MTRYRPARLLLPAAAAAFALALFSGWRGWSWPPALIPAVLLLFSSGLLFFLAYRPVIVIRETSCSVGDKDFLWSEVERVDSARWPSPLLLQIRLRGGRVLRLIYAGEPANAVKLLRQMRRLSRGARIEGVPYKQYWGEDLPGAGEAARSSPPRYRVVRPEEEEEIERLYQKLKSVGRTDRQSSPEEHGE